MTQNKNIAKGRIMVILGCLLMTCVGAGLGYQTRSLYTIPITDELGISRSLYSSTFSVVSLISLGVTINLGRIQKKLGGSQHLALLGFSMHVISLLAASAGRNLWIYYLTTLLTVSGWHFCTTVPVAGLIDNWFQDNKGFFTGLIFAGSGLGGSFFSMLTGGWILNCGWRRSYRISAGIMAAAGLLILLLVRDTPGGRPEKDGTSPNPAEPSPVKEAVLRQSNFWLVGLSMTLLSISLQGITINAPTILSDAGNPTDTVARITGIMLFTSAFSKIFMGIVNDRLGIKVMRTITLFCGILGEGCLIFATRKWALYSYAVLFGLGFSSAMLFMPLHLAVLFPRRNKPAILGYWSAFVGAGSAIGSPLCNLFYEFSGSYTIAILISMLLLGIIWVLLQCTRRPAKA